MPAISLATPQQRGQQTKHDSQDEHDSNSDNGNIGIAVRNGFVVLAVDFRCPATLRCHYDIRKSQNSNRADNQHGQSQKSDRGTAH